MPQDISSLTLGILQQDCDERKLWVALHRALSSPSHDHCDWIL